MIPGVTGYRTSWPGEMPATPKPLGQTPMILRARDEGSLALEQRAWGFRSDAAWLQRMIPRGRGSIDLPAGGCSGIRQARHAAPNKEQGDHSAGRADQPAQSQADDLADELGLAQESRAEHRPQEEAET